MMFPETNIAMNEMLLQPTMLRTFSEQALTLNAAPAPVVMTLPATNPN